jgi:hypothetical protein
MIRYNMTSDERKTIDFQTLEEFVKIVNTQYATKFPRPLSWLGRWLGYTDERTLRDFILKKSSNNHPLFEGEKDYKINEVPTPKNQRTTEMHLSLGI